MTTEESLAGSGTWRELAVSRSLDTARARAESRVQRFLDAALDLMNSSPTGKDFTVQEVVERSGQSLRSFYQYFGGKQELLLALFEESVRSTAELLQARIADEDDPLERLHRFVVEYYRVCRPVRKGKGSKTRPTRAIAEFAQQLLTTQPAEAARAFAPLVSLFEEVLDDAAKAGHVRAEVRRRRVAGVVLEAIMFNAFSTTIGGVPAEADVDDPAEELWDLMLHGIASPA
ncbi:MAG TPA: TetR/AcrR family transcriptional regulator [Acidimicrobiales bacterium]|jgi:AcrR family transcriptional regulator|nr:TetR/AcrR family transcriptional regulator [Acidimicrobiales bacterium]